VKDDIERWPVESAQERYRDRLIGVRTDKVRMPGDTWAERTVVEHPGAVAILALDDANRVLMIRQYRHPVGRMLWEIPAGLRDHEGEDPLGGAQRELLEETGYRAGDWRVLADYYSSPGYSTELLRIFLARDPEPIPAAERDFVPQDEEAFMLSGWLPLDEAVRKVFAGELRDGPAALGIMAAYAARSQGYDQLRAADAPEEQRRSPVEEGSL
jgi:8-oxo-dGDP phosphatase